MADLGKVIKAIEICYTLGHNCTECPLFFEDDCNDKLMHDALSLLKAQGWISVQEGMPPANDMVIVSINDDRGDNDYRYTDTGWYLTEGKCWIVDNEATINVEARMPFPKPYKPPKEET